MDQERRGYLLAMIIATADEQKNWVDSGDSNLLPEDALYSRFQEIADQARVIYAPRAEALEHAILALTPHWRAFVSSQQISADVTMLPSPEFWEAWEELHNLALQDTLPRLKRIEPIKQLLEEKVSRGQICKIYGFVLPDGSPDLEKLQDEIDNPGRHTSPPWVAPVNRDLAAKIEALRIDAEQVSRKREAKIRAATTPAPESIEHLIASTSGGAPITARQIARMKKMTVDQVLAYCEAHNLPKPPVDYNSANLGPGMHDPAISAERRAAMDNLGQDRSPQSQLDLATPGGPVGGLQGPQGDPNADDGTEAENAVLPSGIDLDTLEPEEANQLQEAANYFSQGFDIKQISDSMGLHGNKVRALLDKAGFDLKTKA